MPVGSCRIERGSDLPARGIGVPNPSSPAKPNFSGGSPPGDGGVVFLGHFAFEHFHLQNVPLCCVHVSLAVALELLPLQLRRTFTR